MDSIRKITEQIEVENLSKRAVLSVNTKGRERAEEECELRTAFQRDRDRIIHSKSFRRLKHKTQVFLAPESDHYRTRLTHTLEVSQIARTIARALRLNEDLTEAIALGHDLGHTPFGHAGERALDEIVPEGFRHYEQSVRVCTTIEKNFKGLNLTYEVLDGIKNHTKGQLPETLEGQIVRLADKIAYINHDIDDAVRAGIISENDISADVCAELGNTKSKRINSMVTSVITSSDDIIKMSPSTTEAFNELHAFLFERVYLNPLAKSEESKVSGIVFGIYKHIMEHQNLLPKEYMVVAEKDGFARAVVDYVAGMTDRYAVEIYKSFYVPKSWEQEI